MLVRFSIIVPLATGFISMLATCLGAPAPSEDVKLAGEELAGATASGPPFSPSVAPTEEILPIEHEQVEKSLLMERTGLIQRKENSPNLAEISPATGDSPKPTKEIVVASGKGASKQRDVNLWKSSFSRHYLATILLRDVIITLVWISHKTVGLPENVPRIDRHVVSNIALISLWAVVVSIANRFRRYFSLRKNKID